MSEAKKKGNSDDWDFKVSDEHLEQVQIKKSQVKAADSANLLKRKGTGTPKKKRELQVETKKKKKMTRAAIARRDIALQQQAEIIHPGLITRTVASLIDLGFLGGLYFAGTLLTPIMNQHYVKFLREKGINQTLDPALLNMILAGAFTFVAALLLIYIPAFLYFKTPGKMMMNIRIGHPVIGERPSRFMVFLRELVFKPLSVVSVLGVLIGIKNDDNRCLHDFICRTALFVDD
ncbi:MAG: RDD family protein [Bdellovibrionota bacterium]|nr:RDD family protein [Bdellovibrionota bacterium]